MKSAMFVKFAVALFSTAALSACYTQTPISEFPPAPSTRMIAQVTDSGVVAMANAIGPSAVEVEGVVQGFANDTLRIQMLRVDHRGGASVSWSREIVPFPRYALKSPTTNRLDRKRSWLAAGGIVVGAFLASKAFTALGADSPPDDGTNPQNTLLIPFGLRR